MPVSRQIQDLSFGGNAANNPINYSWTSYINYPNLDTGLTYMRMNVIFFEDKLKVNLQVTALVVLDNLGQPRLGPTDLAILPCPPMCE